MTTARTLWRQFRRALRTAKSLIQSRHLPRWLKVLLMVGCIQIPVLPFDEIALVLALGIIATFYRPVLRAAWKEAETCHSTTT